jgi:hypothetical protein
MEYVQRSAQEKNYCSIGISSGTEIESNLLSSFHSRKAYRTKRLSLTFIPLMYRSRSGEHMKKVD